jgi:nucleotide-binding universal stress UspA family protein
VLDPVKALFAEKGVEQLHDRLAPRPRRAEEILKAATEAQVELIVLGTHGHGISGAR